MKKPKRGEIPVPTGHRWCRWTAIAAVVAITTHILAIVTFGATFWADSADYAALGQALVEPEGLHSFYAASGRWIFSHLQPGTPVLWAALRSCAEPIRWPLLAGIQRSIALLALIHAFRTTRAIAPSRWNLVAVVLLCLLPGYQAFHAALMTESITSSMVLLAFSACLRLALRLPDSCNSLIVAMTAVIVATQFRSYWGAAITLMLVASLLLSGSASLRRLLVISVLAASSALAFPAYRWWKTGDFFLPRSGLNTLVSGLNIDVAPSATVLQAVEDLPLPEGVSAQTLVSRRIDAYACIPIAAHWRSLGMDDDAIVRLAEEVGGKLRNDGLAVQLRRVGYGICSLGGIAGMAIGDPRLEPMRDMTLREMLRHQMYYYRWHAWIEFDDYRGMLDRMLGPRSARPELPFRDPAASELMRSLEPHMRSTPRWLRDPAWLGRVPPDAWFLGGLAATLFLARRVPAVSCLLAILMVCGWATAAWFPLGNTRYAYPLIPVYMVVIGVAAAIRSRAPASPVAGDHTAS
jgi:hypothetical protein